MTYTVIGHFISNPDCSVCAGTGVFSGDDGLAAPCRCKLYKLPDAIIIAMIRRLRELGEPDTIWKGAQS